MNKHKQRNEIKLENKQKCNNQQKKEHEDIEITNERKNCPETKKKHKSYAKQKHDLLSFSL